jgi:hypothetical protein
MFKGHWQLFTKMLKLARSEFDHVNPLGTNSRLRRIKIEAARPFNVQIPICYTH